MRRLFGLSMILVPVLVLSAAACKGKSNIDGDAGGADASLVDAAPGVDAAQMLGWAASVEQFSRHPAARAVTQRRMSLEVREVYSGEPAPDRRAADSFAKSSSA